MDALAKLESARRKLAETESRLSVLRQACRVFAAACRNANWSDLPAAERLIGAGIAIRFPAPGRRQDPADWMQAIRDRTDAALAKIQEKAETFADEVEEMQQMAQDCLEEIESGETYSVRDYTRHLRRFGALGARLKPFAELAEAAEEAADLIDQKFELESKIEDLEAEIEE